MSRENNRKRFLVVVVKTVVKSDFEPVLRNAGKGNMLVPQHVLGLLDRWSSVWIRSPKSSALPTGPHPDVVWKLRSNYPAIIHKTGKKATPKWMGVGKSSDRNSNDSMQMSGGQLLAAGLTAATPYVPQSGTATNLDTWTKRPEQLLLFWPFSVSKNPGFHFLKTGVL